MDAVPEVVLLPLHAPEAVHDVAFVDVHESVELPPLATVLGLAVSVTVGAACVTVTVADRVVVPPALLQASEYVDEVESAPVDAVPEVARLPLHAPEAVHEVALLEDQERVDVPPAVIEAGLADRFTVGGDTWVTVTVALRLVVPPEFVHVSVYVEVAESAPVDAVPEVARLPVHAPDAVQEVARRDDQERVDELPEAIDDGLAEKVTVGADCCC